MNKPTLSVIMPNYNYGQYIGDALQAIFNQSFSPLEVIVVDDASTDNSVTVIKEFIKKYPNLRLLQNEKNMGAIYTMNKGLNSAVGGYIYGAGSDDKVLPGFFEKSMELLSKYPEAGLCFCDWSMIEDGEIIDNRVYLSDKPCYFSPQQFESILLGNEYTVIGGISVIAKRTALIEVHGYKPELLAACDIFAHHTISFRYGACYMPEIAAVLLKHKDQYSTQKFRPLNIELGIVRNAMDIVLTPEYADVLPRFKRTAPFSHRSWDVLKLVLFNKKYREFFSVKLLRFALFDRFIRRVLLRLLPLSFWRRVLNIYKRIKYCMKVMLGGNKNEGH